jgi:DNA-binding transcriptional LysR family regulator
MISRRQLEHAICLHNQGNFTRAAIVANISQSAFSRSIQKLELELGVPLFERHNTSVELTPYGEVFLRRAESIAIDTEELEREMQLMRGMEVGDFSVAMGVYPADVSGNRALGIMLKEYPNLCYRAFVGNWELVNEHVSNRTADLGLVNTEVAETEDHLSVEPVSSHAMVLYCRKNHPLANNGPPSKADLDQFPLVSIRAPARFADAIPGRSQVDRRNGHLVPSVEIDDISTARAVVRESDGLGVAVPLQIESQLKSGEFVLLDFQRPWIEPIYGFVFLKNRAISPAAEVFVEKVIELEQEAEKKNKALLYKYL